MTRVLFRVGWLVMVWIALWGDLTAANLFAGLVVATVLLLAFPPVHDGDIVLVRPLSAARFLYYFARKLLEASAVVAWEVVTPRNRVNEGVVAVPLDSSSRTLTTIVANAISLTPGTLTIEAGDHPTILYVHVLHLHDIESVRRDVQHLERLATRAFIPKQLARRKDGRTT